MATLDLWSMAFVFMLATFVGFEVIRSVSRLLHTPLMSLTNAISAIAVVGAIIVAGEQTTTLQHPLLGADRASFASMTNIVSGFLITDRMLKMFRERRAAVMSVAEHLTQASYLVAAALFIFVAALDERRRRPRARGVVRRRRRHGARDRRHAAPPRDRQLHVDRRRDRRRHRDRRAAVAACR